MKNTNVAEDVIKENLTDIKFYHEVKTNNIEVDVQKIEFINENIYQQYKKEMCKEDDYFAVEEWNNILKYKRDYS